MTAREGRTARRVRHKHCHMVRLEVALVAELISLHRSAFPLWERNDFLPGNHSEMVELMPRIFRPEGPTLGLLATKFGLTAGISVA